MVQRFFQCEVCGTRYEDEARASACETQPVPDHFKVGDIIHKHDGYGWSTGPEHWLIREDRPIFDFYWVVVKVLSSHWLIGRIHNTRLILVTRGVVNGPSVVGSPEWGVSEYHAYIDPSYAGSISVVVNPPVQVREEADEFLLIHDFVPDPRNRDDWSIRRHV